MQHLNVNENDSILCITSAGDNALHYAIDGNPRRIHTVDFNPCQGHLLELKLACINSLEYDDFWLMFGEGKHPRFREVSSNLSFSIEEFED
jgi:betaine lipid synthase